jgi:hypothetical protein
MTIRRRATPIRDGGAEVVDLGEVAVARAKFRSCPGLTREKWLPSLGKCCDQDCRRIRWRPRSQRGRHARACGDAVRITPDVPLGQKKADGALYAHLNVSSEVRRSTVAITLPGKGDTQIGHIRGRKRRLRHVGTLRDLI